MADMQATTSPKIFVLSSINQSAKQLGAPSCGGLPKADKRNFISSCFGTTPILNFISKFPFLNVTLQW
jgi:hypothetical protein